MRERNQPRTEVVTYQVVQIVGELTFFFDGRGPSEEQQQTNRKRTHDEADGSFDEINQNDKSVATASTLTQHILFKGFVQIIPTSPMAELSLIDANLDEYVTRISLDGTLLFADHRY